MVAVLACPTMTSLPVGSRNSWVPSMVIMPPGIKVWVPTMSWLAVFMVNVSSLNERTSGGTDGECATVC